MHSKELNFLAPCHLELRKGKSLVGDSFNFCRPCRVTVISIDDDKIRLYVEPILDEII